MSDKEFKIALAKCFEQAIEEVGLEAFKKISWFASNQKQKNAALA
jgi:hypothetical protein